MKKIVATFVFCLLPALAVAQITVTAPATQINVAAADDFATRAFQDPWDMNERTDFGWWLFSTDAPASNLVNPTFSGGIFSATVTTPGGPISQASLFLLETDVPGTAPVGKAGTRFPINAAAYTHLVFRMRVTTGINQSGAAAGRLLWTPNTIFTGETEAGSILLNNGWFIYDVDIPALPIINGVAGGWGGVIRSLRWMPTQLAGESIDIDWVRLVQNVPSLKHNIIWTGSSNVDIYLDNDSSPGNGTLGRIARGASGGSFSFFVGALPAGDYYAVVVPAETAVGGGSARSNGFFRVNGIPTLTFTSPSEEGSNDDFATARLGNPWDFNTMADIDFKENIYNDVIGPLQLENEAGTISTPQNVYVGTNIPANPQPCGGIGDPQVYTLFWDSKGKTTRIDPNRYRIFTAELGIGNLPRSLPCGSVVRLLWRVAGEPNFSGPLPALNTSEDIILNHKAGSNVLAKLNFDMKALPLDPGSATQTGWNSLPDALPGIDAFRLDPHEFPSATQFYIKRIKLAALERALNGQYTIQWNYGEPNGRLTLQAQNGGQPPITIVSGLDITGGAGSFTWSTVGVPDGTYTITGIFADGVNSNQTFAKWPIVVDNTTGNLPTITLNRSVLNFGIIGGTRTSSQIVRINFSGAGSQCWTAASTNPNITVTPTGGSGPATITISATGAFALGTTSAAVSVSSCASSLNSATVGIAVRNLTFSTMPSGAMDTPLNASTVRGSVAVTGWAVDDIQIARTTVCRDPASGESAPPQGLCGGQPRIFIGEGALIDDARPDIEAFAPTSPFNYRAGWGYLLLTNFLPNQGNGAVNLYAYATDVEGHTVQIGSKTIIAENATSTTPFGAIDTPGQGETICGTQYVNFGWALTQRPKTIPADSSTITVYIDNVPVGNPGPRSARPDITALFSPTYDTSNAVGGFVFNTTAYSNGVHSIFWIVSDSGGNADGIGSRFFTIQNPCTGS